MTLFYTKKFYNTSSGLRLKNIEPVKGYYNDIMDSLWQTRDNLREHRKIKLSLYNNFASVFDYDLTHAILPEPEGSFETADEKASFQRRRLLVQDFYLYVGKELVQYHEALFRNECFPILQTPYMVVDFQEVYDTALADYQRVVMGMKNSALKVGKEGFLDVIDPSGNKVKVTKQDLNFKKNHAVAATYIVPSLLERELVILLKNSVIDQWLEGLKSRTLDADEKLIYDHFHMIEEGKRVFLAGSKESMGKRIWSIGRKYDVLPDDTFMNNIFCNDKIMLNQLLNSEYTEKIICPEHLVLMKRLFGKDDLNLRNNIDHGNSSTYDYLDVSFVSVMMQILIDIASGDIVKDEKQ